MTLFDKIPEMAFCRAYDFFWEPQGQRGALGRDRGVIVQGYADISGAELNYETTSIPGRDGELVEVDDYRSNIIIGLSLAIDNSRARSESIRQAVRELRTWFYGPGRLTLSASPESFYEILKVQLSGLNQELPYYGTLSAKLLARPSEYMWSGVSPVSASDLRNNPFGRSRPIYKITGEGAGVLAVCGTEFEVNVGGNMTIDTDRQQAYRDDGTLQNTQVTGDYTDLWLPHGAIEVSITEGLDLKVIPRWEVPA